MTNITRRKTLAMFVLTMATTLFASLAWAQAKEPLRFGVTMPMTGSQSTQGVDLLTSIQWAVADINAKGGVDGHPLEMIALDSQGEPQLGIAAVNRLVHVEKVPVFIIAWSGVVKAVAPIANREKVLELSVGASSPDIAKLGDYVYTTYPLSDVDVAALARYTVDTLGKKRVAVAYINNDSGVEGARAYRTAFEKAGGQIVAYEAYDPKGSDFSGVVLKMRSSNPEMIHMHGLMTDTLQVMTQMRQLGMNHRVSMYGGVGYNFKLIAQLGAAAEGMIVTNIAPGAKDNPNVQGFIDRWQKTVGHASNALSVTQYTYDGPYLIAELYRWVLKNNLPATGENLRKALLTIKKFDLPMTGSLEVSEDHRVSKPVFLLTVEKGQFVPMGIAK